MMKFMLGVFVGYVAREEIRRVLKEAVKSAVALREDVVDAVAEQRSASTKAD